MSEAHYDRIADLYDAFVQTNLDVPFFISEAKKANGEILELMAGTGRVTLPLVEAGLPVTAVDYSHEMLERLRQKLNTRGLSADVRQADIRQLDLGKRYSQIIIPFQAFPELTATTDQQAAITRIHDHLADDGTFICTLHNPVARLKSVDNQLHLASRVPVEGGQLFVWLLQRYDPQTRLVDVLEFFEEYDTHGTMRAKRFSEVQFHLLGKPAFEELIRSTGFRVVQLYGDYACSPFDEAASPFMIWLLQKA